MFWHGDFWMPDVLIVFSYLPLCYIIFIVKWFYYSSYIKFKPVTIFQALSFWSSNLQYISEGIKTPDWSSTDFSYAEFPERDCLIAVQK